jgi:hypothetical protein
VVLDEVMPPAEGPGVLGVGFSAVLGMMVVELFPVVHVAAPHGLPAGRELAHVQDCGDLIA